MAAWEGRPGSDCHPQSKNGFGTFVPEYICIFSMFLVTNSHGHSLKHAQVAPLCTRIWGDTPRTIPPTACSDHAVHHARAIVLFTFQKIRTTVGHCSKKQCFDNAVEHHILLSSRFVYQIE